VFYTYAHYTPQGRLFYIGKGQGGRAHSKLGRNRYWHRVTIKYGKPNVQILANWDTEQEAFSHEVLLIQCFKELGHKLCNMTNGGEGQTGMTPWNKGKPWSDEIKLKVSKTKKGTPAWNKGIPLTEECKQKLSETMIGRPSWNKGKKHSEEHKLRTGLAKVGNLNCLKNKIIGTNTQTGEQIEFIGAKVINAAGFTHTAVYDCANGKRPQHKGYTWAKQPLAIPTQAK
jgi:hypothetical protein